MFRTWIAAAAFSLAAGLAHAQTEVIVQYPYAELFDGTHKRIIEEFAKVRPDIKVTLRAAYDSYEEGTQKVLREAVTNQMPDVTFQGLNRIRVLVDKNIPARTRRLHRGGEGFRQAGLPPGDVRYRHGQRQGLRAAVRDLAADRLCQP